MGEQKKRKTRGEEKRDRNLHLRLTKTEEGFIEVLSWENNKTKTDMIITALEFYQKCKKGGF